MKLRYYSCAIFLLYAVSESYAQSWKNYPYEPEGSFISFPDDEGRHSEESIEWWYTAGHVVGDVTGNHYSYMLTYFYYPAFGYDGFRILSLNNEDTGEFFNETSPLHYSEMAMDRLNIKAIISQDITESWTNKTNEDGKMIPFEYSLSATASHGALNLESIALKPPLILGESGLFNQGESSYTCYYSLTKNSVTGTITFNGTTETVTGTSWIDRQYGTFNPLTEEDYEWFYIQLSNDIDLNIYNLFTKDRILPGTATYKHMSVYVDTLTQYTTHDFEMERLSFQYMPDSARCYAQKWRLSSLASKIDLIITTLHNNSEVQLPFRFFEGSTTITGTVDGIPVSGIGFAELLHSYEKPDIMITYPTGKRWTSSKAISWDIHNFDAGRPLQYNLECSIDNSQTFFTIVQGLTDSFFYWNNPSLSPGSSCQFKVTAYSIDTTLQNSVMSTEASVFDPTFITSIDVSESDKIEINLFKVYPNPVREIVAIEFPSNFILNDEYIELHLFNLTGIDMMKNHMRMVKDGRLELDIKDIPTGIYILTIPNGYSNTKHKITKL